MHNGTKKWQLRYPGGSSWHTQGANDGPGPAGLELAGPSESVLFDWGVEFGQTMSRPPNPNLLSRRIKKLILTHSHYDHCAGAADLVAKDKVADGWEVVGTGYTLRVLPIALDDMNKAGEADYLDINEVLNRRRIISQPGITQLVDGASMWNGSSGHIRGAMYSCVRLPSGYVGAVMGDCASFDQRIILGTVFPDDVPDEYLPNAIWWTDLTNGQLLPVNPEIEKVRMLQRVSRELEQGRIVALCAFGNGRGPGVALDLIDHGIKPVYIAGVIPDIMKISMQERWCPQDVAIPPIHGLRVIKNNEHFEDLISRGGPLCIVTTSGMGDYGYAAACVREGLPNPAWFIGATSWVHPFSPMGRILNAREHGKTRVTFEDRESGERRNLPLRSGFEQFHRTAHGSIGDTVVMLKKLVARRRKAFGKNKERLDVIFLTHGSQHVKAAASSVFRPFARDILYGNMNASLEIE